MTMRGKVKWKIPGNVYIFAISVLGKVKRFFSNLKETFRFGWYAIRENKILKEIFESRKNLASLRFKISAQREGNAMTLNEIRQQLKTIRLYYTNKARFSAAFDAIPHTVKELADKYAAIVSCAPLDLYYIYYELYVKGLTQEATAEDINYSTEYIRQKNKKLLLFLQSKLNEREVSWLKEIELKNNPLGIRVYAVGEPDIDHMTEEEYNLFASSLAMRINDYISKQKEENDAV